MKHIFKIVFGIIFLIAFSAKADLYTAQDIEISGTGATPKQAKENAITQGELSGFDKVIDSLFGGAGVLEERPTDEEILDMVRDISIVEEKNTRTSYWGKINVRFKEKAIQDLLKKNNRAYLQKAPPTYWLIPLWRQGSVELSLEDENPFYQVLKTQSVLSDFFKMVLPSGDVDELITVNRALENQDFSDAENLALRNGGEQILTVAVEYAPNGQWKMYPVSYLNTANSFYGLSVQGYGQETLLDGWKRLNNQMAFRWQEKYKGVEHSGTTYYARLNVEKMAEWNQLEKSLKKMDFLENLTLQGAMPGQILLNFVFNGTTSELIQRLDQSGWEWISDFSDVLGTLKRKDYYEITP